MVSLVYEKPNKKNQRLLGQFALKIKISLLYVHHYNIGKLDLKPNMNAFYGNLILNCYATKFKQN